ncbi:FG-GAP repeat protein [Enhygromyxa salina]|uniref:FG-GAP repeat protein n=1 Tax=Enhygromyxa salina TaxID=215803 RepID=A0A2S9YPF0_9BACT|nr:FG-GAP repeat protein [Enhygromyxa salina]PRQ06958.1 FG-GAP repeat protein [Enhygromyxa salina]
MDRGDGLTEDNDEYCDENKLNKDIAEAGDHFGWALAAGDFNCDGFDDLAIGVTQRR